MKDDTGMVYITQYTLPDLFITFLQQTDPADQNVTGRGESAWT